MSLVEGYDSTLFYVFLRVMVCDILVFMAPFNNEEILNVCKPLDESPKFNFFIKTVI